jgi:branched-chain amino acid transport system substrate-binding protein
MIHNHTCSPYIYLDTQRANDMTNNKFLKAFMSVSIVSVALILILGVAIAQDSLPTFTIGVLDTAHGPIANGAKLAVREINEAGGVEGADGTFFRLQLVIQPVEDGDILTEAVNNLNQEEIIAVIGPKTTADVLSNLPLLQSLGVPILTPAIGDTVIASDTTGSLFRIRAAERWQGSSLASYLVNQLNLQQITTVQLDRNSTAARVGFSIALEQLSSSTTETSLLLESEDQLDNLVTQIIANNPPAIVTFGEPAIANDFFTLLRIGGWVGAFAYHRADTPEFRNCADTEICRGVIGTTTWSLSSVDLNSNVFLNNYVRAFDEAPGAIEAASYDAVNMLALAIGQPGALRDNLSAIRDIRGVQGMLNTGGLEAREMTNYTAVIQINALGGTDLVARYAGFDRLPEDESTIVDGGELPVLPTATPEGVYVTIESGRQNVRTGPGLEYDVLGQMQQGESAQVIGATADFNWVVILYRGQQGFLATYLLEVTGDRSTVPVVAPPPTPTPPPATLAPTPAPISDVQIIAASPRNITRGEPATINVNVRNTGSVNAGSFAVASSFAPDNLYSAFNVSGLAAGAEIIVPLTVTLSGATGNYTATIIADLNNEINEGPDGEANNDDFNFTYKLDRQLILINSTTLSAGSSIDLEGNVTPVTDISYTGASLDTTAPCTGTASCIGLISPALNWDTSHYDSISSANGVTVNSIPNGSLGVGSTIGVLTAEGRRAVIRVDSFNPGVSITITYRVYQ